MDDTKNIQEEEKEGKEVSTEEILIDQEKNNKKSSTKQKKDETGELKKKIEALENQLMRAVADYRNLEMRFEDEKREFIKFANRELLLRLIPAFDTLFLAEKYVEDEGIKLTVRHLQDALKDVGVETVKTRDAIFDPELMEAIVTSEGEEGKVLEELRPGYTLNGKLVRPAQVKVGKKIDN